MINIEDNRFLNILKSRAQDRGYYFAGLLFCHLALDKWAEELNKHTVIHGYAHIKSILDTLEFIFKDHTDEEVISILPSKYIFILLASIYSHDLGMQDYYCDRLPYLKEKELSIEDLEEIRKNHNEIISDALSNLENNEDLKLFFGSNLKKIENMIDDSEKIRLNELTDLLLNTKRLIAVVCVFHNKEIDGFDAQIELLRHQRKLIIDATDIKYLKFVAALLQLGDALDMASKRINRDDFLSEVNAIEDNLERLHTSKLNTLGKKFMCYVIDDIAREKSPKEIKFIFKMSLPTTNLENNAKFIEECKEKFARRLKRNDHDCARIVGNFLGIRITIHISEEEINSNDDKKVITQIFFNLMEKEPAESLESLLELILHDIKSECTFLYLKLYSKLADTFFGGIALCDDSKIKKELERLHFQKDEWKIDCAQERNYYDYSNGDIFKILRNKKDSYKYINYVRYSKELNIKSELYLVIKYSSEIIGFVNIHFDRELSKSELTSFYGRHHKKISSLGFSIIKFHESNICDIERILKSCKFLSENNQKFFLKSYKKIFHGSPIEDVENVSIREIKEFLKINPVTVYDDTTCIKINYTMFKWLYDVLFRKYLSSMADTKTELINSRRSPYIQLKFHIKRKGSLPVTLIPADYLRKAETYLKSLDLNPKFFSISLKLAEYLFPFKLFFSFFAGKISPTLINDEHLIINVFLPKRKLFL